ncbi:MAG: phosphoribosylanthranilate isomerase, partial [Planctomycetaceae bacterium]|nr:phosphoribosylanthranilate isomerase [Planctomycetaceae bacterium]
MWVKICGVRDVAEALDVAAAAPDAIGLNFYPKSKRYVSPEIAAAICAELPTEIERVGVFVDHLPDEIAALARKLKLTRVQLHGDYDLEAAATLQEFRPVWVHRMLDADLTSLQKLFCTAHEKGIRFSACLIDAAVPGQLGGSGQT